MRLKRLHLRNWRSFPAADIDLDNDVTVIVGQNGAGKTALLNAFVWCLYGETTSGFPRPKDLCNHQAKLALEPGESTEVQVMVVFSHRDHEYEARRSISIERTGTDGEDFAETEPDFVLNIHPTAGGYHRTLGALDADRDVRAILPIGLNPYFFFPAENIGTATAPDSDAVSVKEAVEILLGVKRYDIALTAIRKSLQHKKLKARQTDDLKLAKALQEADSTREAYDKVTARLKQLPDAIRDAKRILDEAEAQFKRFDGARALIERRGQMQRDHDLAQREANDAVDLRSRVLDEECFNLFGLGVLESARRVLDKAKADRKLPPKVSAGLLDALIDGTDPCICGTPITDAERGTLRELRATIVEDTLVEAASTIRARVTQKHARLLDRPDAEQPHKRLQGAQTTIHDAHAQRKTLEDALKEFDIPDWATADPSATWREYQRKHAALLQEQKDLEIVCEDLLQKRRAADKKYGQLARQKDSSDKVVNARGHLQNLENTFENLHRLFSSSARGDTQRIMNSIARDVFLRDYTIQLTDRFELKVRQDGLDVGASSGESAWVTFAFVGALARLIPQYGDIEDMDEAGDAELDPAQGYPLVLDAPFSPFGAEYATQFAARLPGLAKQSVVIIREDQIDHLGPIMASDASVAAYLLCLHGPRDDIEQTITWGNENWGDRSVRPYVQPAGDPSKVRTEILALPT